MSWNDPQKQYIFKIRKLKDKVNTKGARVDQAENKNIISYINEVLGSTYEKDDKIIKQMDGKQKLAVCLEIIIRAIDDKTDNGHKYFLNNEQMLLFSNAKN